MLKMLEAHGRAMFGEVVLPATAVTSSTSKGKGRALNSGQTNDTDEEMDNEDDEWDDDVDEDVEDRDDGDYDDDEEQDQDSIGDDGEILVDSTPAVISGAGSSRAPEVVFAPQIGRSQSSNADYKSFMVRSHHAFACAFLFAHLTDRPLGVLTIELQGLQGRLRPNHLYWRYQEGARCRKVSSSYPERPCRASRSTHPTHSSERLPLCLCLLP